MVQNNKPGRRNFLASLAILSAAAAAGSIPSFFISDENAYDMESQWKSFLNRYGGKRIYGKAMPVALNQVQPPKGHIYTTGEGIHFEKNTILAYPTWIYFNKDLKKPSDVIITFIENNQEQKKIGRINRYELIAFNKSSGDRTFIDNICKLEQISGYKTDPGLIYKKNGRNSSTGYYSV